MIKHVKQTDLRDVSGHIGLSVCTTEKKNLREDYI